MINFRECFGKLTEKQPFDWQERLFDRFMSADFPEACDIPTGLGKTSVMAIWLIALAHMLKERTRKIPLRLVYVVDRRVIVDQATAEAESLLKKLTVALSDESNPLHLLAQTFRAASMKGQESLIALSTLRGQKADNREWCLDPSRPAIIIGTVDMIGSRMLFTGYGKVGINHRSLQAGLLGQDSLIVIDEAHLSPCFVATQLDIRNFVQQGQSLRPFHVMSLSATLSGASNTLALNEEQELRNETAERRLNARKYIEWLPFDQRAKAKAGKKATPPEIREALAERLVNRAIQHEVGDENTPPKSVIIFAQTVELVNLIFDKLKAALEEKSLAGREATDKKAKAAAQAEINNRILKMTGEMRGWERDKLTSDLQKTELEIMQMLASASGAERDELIKVLKFMRFSPNQRDRATPRPTHYMIATSCAEVGVNLDADHGLCDLSTLDSMIQRIGRINRFGLTDSTITVVIDELGLQAAASDFQKDEEHKQHLANFAAEIAELQAQTEILKSDREAKQSLQKQIRAKSDQHKKLAKNGAERGQKEIERERPKVYFTWLALKSREENGKVKASPLALRGLLAANQRALPDEPVRPPLDQARLDDWAMTSLKQKEFARPLAQYWLRGVIDDEQAQTTFVWRAELDCFDVTNQPEELAELVTAIPVQPQERAAVATFRAEKLLTELAKKHPQKLCVLIDAGGEAEAFRLASFADDKTRKGLFAQIAFAAVILPAGIGGLDDDGNPDAKGTRSFDVVNSAEWARYLITRRAETDYSIKQLNLADGTEAIFSTWQEALKSVKGKGVLVNRSDLQNAFTTDEEPRAYIACFRQRITPDAFFSEEADDQASLDLAPRTVKQHDEDVELFARDLGRRIGLPDDLIEALAAAGVRHDLGKARDWWQKAIGNFTGEFYAKSNNNSFDHNFNQGYRHEFGSLVESLEDDSLEGHPHRDLILHLIASHHGYARPHFPERAFDRKQPKPLNQQIAHEALLRFDRLQRQYGWWQLAYLEAVLKAADALASRAFSRGEFGGEQ
ncbi:MAG: type I-U CRISPR-associated helicase/endonuclease Cas3 [Blastocatellales bacterium]